MSKSVADKSQFPIFKTRAGFDDKGKPMIRGLHPDAKEIIQRLQPYNQGNRPGRVSTLWILSVLSNSDKHRLPHLAAAAPHQFTILGTHLGSVKLKEADGETLHEQLGLSYGRLNRAVDYIREYGIADVVQYLGTSPYTFGLVRATRRTRIFMSEDQEQLF